MGLVVPAAATALMGEVGAIMVLTMLFMAVTSAGSAELIAVSSLITYDIYRTYKNPNATGKQLVKVSRITIVGFGLGMGGLAVILLHMGLSLGFVYLAMGILIGSAVIPIALTILWKRTNRVAATAGAVIGLLGSCHYMGLSCSIPARVQRCSRPDKPWTQLLYALWKRCRHSYWRHSCNNRQPCIKDVI